MVLVIVTHCIVPYQFAGEKWVPYIWIFIMTFTMPMFTVISGYLYKDRSLKEVIARFLYPCVIFSFLNNYIGGGIPLYVEKVGAGYFKIGYTMWYLWALFIYYAIVPIIIRNLGWKSLVVIGLSGVFITDFIPLPNSIIQLCRVINFFPFFLLGMFLRRNTANIQIVDVPLRIRENIQR